ncbi:MAG TPA: hypothetical protein VMF10_05730 [Candidatus Aquilonibacter sp.]|nr:hypothetical protein [Candidatus Aquilonibacter sp.]
MRTMAELIIGGWVTTIAMFVLFGLCERGRLITFRRKLVSALDYLASVLRVPEDSMESKPQA